MAQHDFKTTAVDMPTGREYRVCKKCGQVMVQGDDFFNMQCQANSREIEDVKARAMAERWK